MSPSTQHMAVSVHPGNNKMLMVAVIIAVLLSVIAVIVALVSVGKIAPTNINVSSSPANIGSSGPDDDDDKIWLFAIGTFGTYFDDVTGENKGFRVDLVNAVCKIANKNCETVFDTTQRCWDSQAGRRSHAGEGIMAGYYDACTGWLQTYDRRRTLRFSEPYYINPAVSGFITLAGNPGSFNWSNLTGYIIGFVDGKFFDEHCIARLDGIQGNVLSQYQIRHYAHEEAMFEALNDGEVDAVFTNTRLLGADYSVVSGGYFCTIAGSSVMTRKDNGLIDWWNPAFEKLKSTSQWQDICNDKTAVHGHYAAPACL